MLELCLLAPLYTNNFESAELDKVPDDMLVLDGAFAVKQDDSNKFLELPGAPLDTFGVLFGPATNANVTVTAKIFGTKRPPLPNIWRRHQWRWRIQAQSRPIQGRAGAV